MKRFFNRAIIVILVAMGSMTSQAQNLSIDTTLTINFLLDTATLGTSEVLSAVVRNIGVTPLTGNIYLVRGVDTLGTGALNRVDTVQTKAVTNLALSDTTLMTWSEDFNASNTYKRGDGNVIVLWAIADFGTTADTLRHDIHLLDPVSVKEHQFIDPPYFYPNPAKRYVTFENYNHLVEIKQVRMFNLEGKEVLNRRMKKKMDVSHLQKGIYFIRLETVEGQSFDYKLIKE